MRYKVEIQEVRRGFIYVEADIMGNAARVAADAYLQGKTDWKTRKSNVLHVRVKNQGDREWQQIRWLLMSYRIDVRKEKVPSCDCVWRKDAVHKCPSRT